jgi:hypothetical protein
MRQNTFLLVQKQFQLWSTTRTAALISEPAFSLLQTVGRLTSFWNSNVGRFWRIDIKFPWNFVRKWWFSCEICVSSGRNSLLQFNPFYLFLSVAQKPLLEVKSSSLLRLHDHTQTHHTRYDFSGRVIFPTQKPLPDNEQQSQKTCPFPPTGIRTNNTSKLAAADSRLRPRCHWDFFCLFLLFYF